MALSISCNNPPAAFFGVFYSHAFPATGGTPPYSFAITAGALPTGLGLDAGTGVVSGTATVQGLFPFTIQVTDFLGAMASVACSINVPGCMGGSQGA